jgi:hypothetical protein
MDLLILSVNQIREGDIFWLASRAVKQKLHKIGGSKECSGQMIQMHDRLISTAIIHHPSSIIRHVGLWILRFY